MSEVRYLVGDVRAGLAKLEDSSVDLCLTSPPFLAVRDYLDGDDPSKPLELGREDGPAQYVAALLEVVADLRRVLAPHGSIVIELGDTYSGSGGAGGDYAEDGWRDGAPRFDGSAARARRTGADWPEPKSLAMIPETFRIALAYGFHPLTGKPSPAGRWIVRNVVRWTKPNPPVGFLGDKFRPGTTELVVACTSATRYFDLDAVRGGDYKPRRDVGRVLVRDTERAKVGLSSGKPTTDDNPGGAPPYDYWHFPTEAYPGAHYATWPRRLVVRPIEAMAPSKVCRECGEPRRRIVERSLRPIGGTRGDKYAALGFGGGERTESVAVTIGFTDCGHNDWRRGVVLDPFAGTGTTLAVAIGHGRDAIGIDLDRRNVALAEAWIGPLFFSSEVVG